jgi:hypothetical protein
VGPAAPPPSQLPGWVGRGEGGELGLRAPGKPIAARSTGLSRASRGDRGAGLSDSCRLGPACPARCGSLRLRTASTSLSASAAAMAPVVSMAPRAAPAPGAARGPPPTDSCPGSLAGHGVRPGWTGRPLGAGRGPCWARTGWAEEAAAWGPGGRSRSFRASEAAAPARAPGQRRAGHLPLAPEPDEPGPGAGKRMRICHSGEPVSDTRTNGLPKGGLVSESF